MICVKFTAFCATLHKSVHKFLSCKLALSLGLGSGLGLVFWLVLGFVLVVYSAGPKYRWLIFVVVPSVQRGYLVRLHLCLCLFFIRE